MDFMMTRKRNFLKNIGALLSREPFFCQVLNMKLLIKSWLSLNL